MDILALLERQLTFIERFYNRTVEPFENIHRKIRDGEEPFVSTPVVEDDDEPRYLDEWLEADEIAEVLGQCALGLAENALHNYLRGFAKRYFNAHEAGTFEPYYRTFRGNSCFLSMTTS